MSNILTRELFTSWVKESQTIRYPDRAALFSNTEIVLVDDIEYVISHYAGVESMPLALSYDDYFDKLKRPSIYAETIQKIKSAQSQLLDSLEGTPTNRGLWQRKAIEEVTIKSSFERYDTLMKNKAYVINHGNAEELKLPDLTPEKLMSYSIKFDLSKAPEIVIRRLTVGAFQMRFTKYEREQFKSPDAPEEYAMAYDSLITRSHIHLDNATIAGTLAALAEAGKLEAEPLDKKFDSRLEELMRNGDLDEQFRVISYV